MTNERNRINLKTNSLKLNQEKEFEEILMKSEESNLVEQSVDSLRLNKINIENVLSSSTIKSTKEKNENILMRWSAVLFSIGTIIIIWRFLSILILAAWLSSICRPLIEWFVNKFPLKDRCREKNSRSAIAAFLLLFFVLVVILPVILIVVALTGSTMDFLTNLSNSTTAMNAIHFLVPPIDSENSTRNSSSNSTIQTFKDLIKTSQNTFSLIERFLLQRDTISNVVQLFGGKALSVLSIVAGATTQFIIGIMIFLASTYTFLLDGVQLWQWSLVHSPLSEKHMNRLKNAFLETGRGLLLGVGLTCFVQGFISGLAYLCLKIPRWYALGVLTGLCSLIPILGTAIVWIPITIGLFLQEYHIKAIIMILIGIFIIGSIDNLLRPIFSRIGSLKMSTLLLLLTIFGGLQMLGGWGALLGPLTVRLAIEALILVREDQDEQDLNR